MIRIEKYTKSRVIEMSDKDYEDFIEWLNNPHEIDESVKEMFITYIKSREDVNELMDKFKE